MGMLQCKFSMGREFVQLGANVKNRIIFPYSASKNLKVAGWRRG